MAEKLVNDEQRKALAEHLEGLFFDKSDEELMRSQIHKAIPLFARPEQMKLASVLVKVAKARKNEAKKNTESVRKQIKSNEEVLHRCLAVDMPVDDCFDAVLVSADPSRNHEDVTSTNLVGESDLRVAQEAERLDDRQLEAAIAAADLYAPPTCKPLDRADAEPIAADVEVVGGGYVRTEYTCPIDQSLEEFQTMVAENPYLISLNMDRVCYGAPHIQELAKLTKLEILYMRNSRTCDLHLKELIEHRPPSLKELYLGDAAVHRTTARRRNALTGVVIHGYGLR